MDPLMSQWEQEEQCGKHLAFIRKIVAKRNRVMKPTFTEIFQSVFVRLARTMIELFTQSSDSLTCTISHLLISTTQNW
jgi:hypothetical protein